MASLRKTYSFSCILPSQGKEVITALPNRQVVDVIVVQHSQGVRLAR